MGGVGGSPPKYSIIKVKYKKFGGKPPTPPIASRLYILYQGSPVSYLRSSTSAARRLTPINLRSKATYAPQPPQ